MTIKATLAYGKSFHFYHQALDNNHVYLELEDVPYDAGYRRIMVAIPIDVWEVIRGLGAADLGLVNTSDEDLMKLVNDRVDERIAEYGRTKKNDSQEAVWLRFKDLGTFGAMDAPREQQIVRGIEYYIAERERQRAIAIRIAQHKILNINSDTPENLNNRK